MSLSVTYKHVGKSDFTISGLKDNGSQIHYSQTWVGSEQVCILTMSYPKANKAQDVGIIERVSKSFKLIPALK